MLAHIEWAHLGGNNLKSHFQMLPKLSFDLLMLCKDNLLSLRGDTAELCHAQLF